MLVDTSVWSIGFRRQRSRLNSQELRIYYAWQELLADGYASIIGPVRQEVLSGLETPQEFEALRLQLQTVPDLKMTTSTFELAAEYFNMCQKAGISGGTIDMMICASAVDHDESIFTTDPDFMHYADVLPIGLYVP